MMETINLQETVEEIAEKLFQEFGDEAILKAALSAREAMASGNIDNCIMWRDVLNILEMNKGSCTIKQ